MHTISLENKCEIGHRTLFSAAYWNDVDCFPEFCDITKDEKLDQAVVAQIKALRDEKLESIRAVWETLPKAAVQGDISINNLVYSEDGLIVFDYNNAGDEVLISDLVMEGLLTAYEMELHDGTPASYREQIFPALLKGYLSVRSLSEAERKTAWEVYTLYHGLWFTRIVTYNDFYYTNMVVAKDKSSVLMFDYNLLGKGYAYTDVRNVLSSLAEEAGKAFLDEYGEFDPVEKALDDVVSVVVTLYLACLRDEFPWWAQELLDEIDTTYIKKIECLRSML